MARPPSPDTPTPTHEILEWLTDAWTSIEGAEQRETFLQRVTTNGVAPIWGRHLESEGHEVPEQITEYRRSLGVRVAINRHQMLQTLDLLDQNHVDAVVLKGEPLARKLFGHPHARSTFDIDLLVSPDQFWRAVHVLESSGFKRANSYKPWAFNQVAFHRQNPTVEVELHWQLAHPSIPTPDTDDLIRRRRHVDLEGSSVPVLDDDSNFLQICYHFHQHRGFLKGLLDIAAWLERDSGVLARSSLLETLDQLQLRGLVSWPLATLTRLSPPFSIPREYSPDFPVRLLAHSTWHRIRATYEDLTMPLSSTLPDSVRKTWLTMLDCIDMGVLDTTSKRLIHGLKPLFLGPHRLGRTLEPLLYPFTRVDDPGPEPPVNSQ